MATPSSAESPDPAAAPPSLHLGPNPAYSSAPPPLLPLPSHFPPQSILGRPPNPSPSSGILYAASRGYPPRPSVGRGYSSPHMVTVANPAGYIRNNNPTTVVPFPVRPAGFHSDHGVQMYQHHQRLQRQHQGTAAQGRPPFQQPQAQISRSRSAGASPTPELAPVSTPPLAPKISPFPAEKSKNDPRERIADDGAILLHDRKVKLSENPSDSLYGLCRSWLRNGSPHQVQDIKFGDGVQLLPKPLPRKAAASTSSGNIPMESEESVDQLSARDLLRRHVKRARRVRACLNEERLQRIERYKQRLALLLPLPTESDRSPGS